jgi:[acyl-carrier-protein] S-malonyltransferase
LSTIAFVFPGQGSQSLGMLSELAAENPSIHALFDEVSEQLNYDVWKLTQQGPLELLNQTAHTQVAMLTADVAVFRVLEKLVPISKSAIFAGHSLGEYSALVCADALSLSDAARLVQIRGQLMQETVPLGLGAMAAIVGLSDDAVALICQNVSTKTEYVSPANYNAVGQIVIAGHTKAVEEATASANDAGAHLAKIISVSVPCHCDLLRPAAARFSEVLNGISFKTPERVVISSVDLKKYSDLDDMRAKLAAQLYLPVRWVETIQSMQQLGVNYIFECGPGKVLSGLIKRIDRSIHVLSINNPQTIHEAQVAIQSSKESK